ncbi:MAG TPA: TonB-dependent receptor [Gemmatimonadaceae bacterium]|nr:TonB-dependent receptor [Gemmatimonadaceae bacterium]
MRATVLTAAIAVLVTFVSPASAYSQAITAPVAGTVRDSAGSPVPHAQVAIIGLDRVTTTDGAGRFRFEFVPPGRYELYTTIIGYAPVRTPITVPPAQGTEVAVVMRPSAVRLAAVQVTATRFAADPLDVTQSTVELSGQALNRSLGSTVAQTLSAEPGLSMRYNGPAANMPVVRGLTGDRVLVLQNGERVGDLAAPTPDHALTIDPLNATSIEVVRGPAALLYGSNALGGVVNVITRDIPTSIPNHFEGQVAVQGESVNPGGALSLAFTAPLARSIALTGGGSRRQVSDVRTGGGAELLNSFARQTGGQMGLGFVGDRLAGGAAYQITRMRYGLPADPDDPEFLTIDGQRQQVSARGDLRFDGTRIPIVRLDATGQWYEHDEIEPDGEIGTHFDLKTQTFSATARTLFGSPGALGTSGFFRQYSAAGEEALTPPANSRSLGVYAFQDFTLGRGDSELAPHLHVGARYDATTIESEEGDERFGDPVKRNFGTFSGSVGFVFPLSSVISFNANVARAFRAPTVEELFSNGIHAATGTFDVGNAQLRAETNTGGELVLRGRSARTNAQLSAFYNRIDDYIAVNIVGDTLLLDEDEIITQLPLNRYAQTDATLRGLEGHLEGEIVRGLVLGVMGDAVRGRLRDGTPLPFMPAARLGALARWQRGQLSLETDYRHGFAQRSVPPAATGEDPSAVPTEPYDLVNVSLGYNIVGGGLYHTITLRIDNLFDEEYRDATSRIKQFAFNPGRNFALVYRVLF